MGEYLVSAYLRLIESCDIVEYNFVLPRQIDSQGEIDVVGLNFQERKLYLCEVTTHLQTMNYGSRDETTQKIKQKLLRNHKYAETVFPDWKACHMIWAPTVGQTMTNDLEVLINDLNNIDVTFIFNEEYARRVLKLIEMAVHDIKDYKEPFFRSLQILTHLRMPNRMKLFNLDVVNDQPEAHRTSQRYTPNPLSIGHTVKYHYEAAVIVLRKHDEPLHVEDLTRKLKENFPNLFPVDYNSHKLQATISSYLHVFKRFGDGMVGLHEWSEQ